MPFQQFEYKNLAPATLERIKQANEIIIEYQNQGYTLTLRQLYYQFVARGMIANSQRSYNQLGDVVSKGRLNGLIDWLAIEDRTRNLVSPSTWESPADIIDTCAAQFRVDLWEGQDVRPEVWVEKEALVGVFAPICDELGVAYFACRGYVSQSEQWRAGRRIAQRRKEQGQQTLILHFGDHDPSGIDMTRDNGDRLEMFSRMGVEVRRLALNMAQVEEYRPPPNPAKMTDSRFEKYLENYGSESWELDALEPSLLVRLVRDAVEDVIDPELMKDREHVQDEGRERLRQIAADEVEF